MILKKLHYHYRYSPGRKSYQGHGRLYPRKADCQERFILNQMDDKTGALEKLKAIMAKAEQVEMSSVKIGDIIYVPLDEEDGLILKDGYKDRNKYIVIIGFTPEGVAIGALLINSEIDSSKRVGRATGLPISFDGSELS